MNVHVPPERIELEPWRFTVRDVERMVASGILAEDDRVELIEGRLVRMAPKGNDHEGVKDPLVTRLARSLPERLLVSVETTLRLSSSTVVEPDLLVYDGARGRAGLNTASALLVVEIAVSTLRFDLGPKADLYAAHGVRELWVVDVAGRRTVVHRAPGSERYDEVSEHTFDVPLTPHLVPEVTLKLSEIAP